MTDRDVRSIEIDRYGRGYHGIGVGICPHCDRETYRRNLIFSGMGAKSQVCPWCSRNLISRLFSRMVRAVVPDTNQEEGR